MKAFSIVLLILAAGTSVSAQTRRQVLTLRIHTSVECQICKQRLEDYLKREPGIAYMNVDYHTKIVQIRYYTDITNPQNVLTAIANAGYDADSISANPDSYNMLPACCKKGGMAALKAASRKAH